MRTSIFVCDGSPFDCEGLSLIVGNKLCESAMKDDQIKIQVLAYLTGFGFYAW